MAKRLTKPSLVPDPIKPVDHERFQANGGASVLSKIENGRKRKAEPKPKERHIPTRREIPTGRGWLEQTDSRQLSEIRAANESSFSAELEAYRKRQAKELAEAKEKRKSRDIRNTRLANNKPIGTKMKDRGYNFSFPTKRYNRKTGEIENIYK